MSTGRVVIVACYESINLANELSLNVLRGVMRGAGTNKTAANGTAGKHAHALHV